MSASGAAVYCKRPGNTFFLTRSGRSPVPWRPGVVLLEPSHFLLFLNAKSFKTIFEQGICVCVTWLLLLFSMLLLLKRIIIINKNRKDNNNNNKKVLEEKDTKLKKKKQLADQILCFAVIVCMFLSGRWGLVELRESTTATDRISKYINIFALLVVNER